MEGWPLAKIQINTKMAARKYQDSNNVEGWRLAKIQIKRLAKIKIQVRRLAKIQMNTRMKSCERSRYDTRNRNNHMIQNNVAILDRYS